MDFLPTEMRNKISRIKIRSSQYNIYLMPMENKAQVNSLLHNKLTKRIIKLYNTKV